MEKHVKISKPWEKMDVWLGCLVGAQSREEGFHYDQRRLKKGGAYIPNGCDC